MGFAHSRSSRRAPGASQADGGGVHRRWWLFHGVGGTPDGPSRVPALHYDRVRRPGNRPHSREAGAKGIPTYGVGLGGVNWEKLAQGFGADGVVADSEKSLGDAIGAASEVGKTTGNRGEDRRVWLRSAVQRAAEI